MAQCISTQGGKRSVIISCSYCVAKTIEAPSQANILKEMVASEQRVEEASQAQPSDFNSNDRTKLMLDILGGEELKLRKGEANDALHSLCEHIRHTLLPGGVIYQAL